MHDDVATTRTIANGFDGALVNDACSGYAFQCVIANPKLRIGDIFSGGHQSSHLHLCVFAKHHTVWVEQKNLAIRLQVAINF